MMSDRTLNISMEESRTKAVALMNFPSGSLDLVTAL